MRLWDEMKELLFPNRCVFCYRFTGGPDVCPKCRESLPYTRGGGQRQRFQFVDTCVSPLYYEGDARESLRRYKFHDLPFYWKIYRNFLSKCVDGNEISCDIITWVPLSRRRLRERHYDQARLLAEGLAERMGVPCVKLLVKVGDNPAQSGLSGREARRANVSGMYRAAAPEQTAGKRVLLVDDIVTTGSTLNECAAVLRLAGAESVSAATVARGREE